MRSVILMFLLVSCAHRVDATIRDQVRLPASLVGKVVPLLPEDPAIGAAAAASAQKPGGQGGLVQAVVVRVVVDLPVWRGWSGPDKKDARGNTNRLGQWWTFDPPHGSVEAYRRDYEVCANWNDLTMMARCTLRAGAVVAVGPGQSVSAETCGTTESYPANAEDWQLFVAGAWSRPELECPDSSLDMAIDPEEISRAR